MRCEPTFALVIEYSISNIGDFMKKFCYLVFLLFFGACSVSTEEDTTDYGTSDGSASAPV